MSIGIYLNGYDGDKLVITMANNSGGSFSQYDLVQIKAGADETMQLIDNADGVAGHHVYGVVQEDSSSLTDVVVLLRGKTFVKIASTDTINTNTPVFSLGSGDGVVSAAGLTTADIRKAIGINMVAATSPTVGDFATVIFDGLSGFGHFVAP